MMTKQMNRAAIGLALILSGVSQANAAFDVTAITAAATDVGAVGAAVFAVVVAIKVFKWARSSL